MIQRNLKYYDRRFLDEEPTQSIASRVALIEEDYACIRWSDGSNTSTFDFFFSTPEERELSLRKLERMQTALNAFACALVEQVAKVAAQTENGHVKTAIALAAVVCAV